MTKPMTAAQIKKLETILAKVETLQRELRGNDYSHDHVGRAKDELLDVLRRG